MLLSASPGTLQYGSTVHAEARSCDKRVDCTMAASHLEAIDVCYAETSEKAIREFCGVQAKFK